MMTEHHISVHPDNICLMEAELAKHGISVSEMCRRASVAVTTWGRWKRKEVSPTFKTWDAVVAAYRQLVPEATDDSVTVGPNGESVPAHENDHGL